MLYGQPFKFTSVKLLLRAYQGLTVVSPYVGMMQKQDGGSNECISNYTTITRLGPSVTHFEALF